MTNLGKYHNPYSGFWRTVFENSHFWHLIVNTGDFFANFAHEHKNYNLEGKSVGLKSFCNWLLMLQFSQ